MWVVYISQYLQFVLFLFSSFNAQFSLAVNLFACFNFAHLMLMLFISILISWLKIVPSMPRFMTVGRMNYLKKLFNFLKRNQNEDCLYLNIYAPEAFGRSYSAKMPVIKIWTIEMLTTACQRSSDHKDMNIFHSKKIIFFLKRWLFLSTGSRTNGTLGILTMVLSSPATARSHFLQYQYSYVLAFYIFLSGLFKKFRCREKKSMPRLISAYSKH